VIVTFACGRNRPGMPALSVRCGSRRVKTSTHKLQQVGSAALAFAAITLLLLAIVWPSRIAEMLHSRLGVSLTGAWCCVLALFLHPKSSAGLLQGIREFRKATDEVTLEIRGDDDENGPRPT
jgi:hypothetical protein